MADKITELTPEQFGWLEADRDEWLGVGTCTDPADFAKAEAAIAKMYEALGEPRPAFVRCKSPLDAHVQMHIINTLLKIKEGDFKPEDFIAGGTVDLGTVDLGTGVLPSKLEKVFSTFGYPASVKDDLFNAYHRGGGRRMLGQSRHRRVTSALAPVARHDSVATVQANVLRSDIGSRLSTPGGFAGNDLKVDLHTGYYTQARMRWLADRQAHAGLWPVTALRPTRDAQTAQLRSELPMPFDLILDVGTDDLQVELSRLYAGELGKKVPADSVVDRAMWPVNASGFNARRTVMNSLAHGHGLAGQAAGQVEEDNGMGPLVRAILADRLRKPAAEAAKLLTACRRGLEELVPRTWKVPTGAHHRLTRGVMDAGDAAASKMASLDSWSGWLQPYSLDEINAAANTVGDWVREDCRAGLKHLVPGIWGTMYDTFVCTSRVVLEAASSATARVIEPGMRHHLEDRVGASLLMTHRNLVIDGARSATASTSLESIWNSVSLGNQRDRMQFYANEALARDLRLDLEHRTHDHILFNVLAPAETLNRATNDRIREANRGMRDSLLDSAHVALPHGLYWDLQDLLWAPGARVQTDIEDMTEQHLISIGGESLESLHDRMKLQRNRSNGKIYSRGVLALGESFLDETSDNLLGTIDGAISGPESVARAALRPIDGRKLESLHSHLCRRHVADDETFRAASQRAIKPDVINRVSPMLWRALNMPLSPIREAHTDWGEAVGGRKLESLDLDFRKQRIRIKIGMAGAADAVVSDVVLARAGGRTFHGIWPGNAGVATSLADFSFSGSDAMTSMRTSLAGDRSRASRHMGIRAEHEIDDGFLGVLHGLTWQHLRSLTVPARLDLQRELESLSQGIGLSKFIVGKATEGRLPHSRVQDRIVNGLAGVYDAMETIHERVGDDYGDLHYDYDHLTALKASIRAGTAAAVGQLYRAGRPRCSHGAWNQLIGGLSRLNFHYQLGPGEVLERSTAVELQDYGLESLKPDIHSQKVVDVRTMRTLHGFGLGRSVLDRIWVELMPVDDASNVVEWGAESSLRLGDGVAGQLAAMTSLGKKLDFKKGHITNAPFVRRRIAQPMFDELYDGVQEHLDELIHPSRTAAAEVLRGKWLKEAISSWQSVRTPYNDYRGLPMTEAVYWSTMATLGSIGNFEEVGRGLPLPVPFDSVMPMTDLYGDMDQSLLRRFDYHLLPGIRNRAIRALWPGADAPIDAMLAAMPGEVDELYGLGRFLDRSVTPDYPRDMLDWLYQDHLHVEEFTEAILNATSEPIKAPVAEKLKSLLDASPVEYHGTYFWGQQDAYWIAFYKFVKRLGVTYPKDADDRLGWHEDIARSANWWWPFKGVCFISDRPESICMRDGRLHNESGPAIRFRDGWSLWVINGVRVDEQIVMRPETQTTDQIRQEPNAEVKRIRLERFGWEPYLNAVGAVELDRRDNDIEATTEVLMRSEDGMTVLVCACPSTARTYALEVRDGITTCEAAQRWLSGGLTSRIVSAS